VQRALPSRTFLDLLVYTHIHTNAHAHSHSLSLSLSHTHTHTLRWQCDDGGAEDGDGCSALCQVEPSWTCSFGSLSRSRVHEPAPYPRTIDIIYGQF